MTRCLRDHRRSTGGELVVFVPTSWRTGALFRRILRYQCTVYTNNHSDVRSGMSAVSHLARQLQPSRRRLRPSPWIRFVSLEKPHEIVMCRGLFAKRSVESTMISAYSKPLRPATIRIHVTQHETGNTVAQRLTVAAFAFAKRSALKRHRVGHYHTIHRAKGSAQFESAVNAITTL